MQTCQNQFGEEDIMNSREQLLAKIQAQIDQDPDTPPVVTLDEVLHRQY